jgi:hypothetical protein
MGAMSNGVRIAMGSIWIFRKDCDGQASGRAFVAGIAAVLLVVGCSNDAQFGAGRQASHNNNRKGGGAATEDATGKNADDAPPVTSESLPEDAVDTTTTITNNSVLRTKSDRIILPTLEHKTLDIGVESEQFVTIGIEQRLPAAPVVGGTKTVDESLARESTFENKKPVSQSVASFTTVPDGKKVTLFFVTDDSEVFLGSPAHNRVRTALLELLNGSGNTPGLKNTDWTLYLAGLPTGRRTKGVQTFCYKDSQLPGGSAASYFNGIDPYEVCKITKDTAANVITNLDKALADIAQDFSGQNMRAFQVLNHLTSKFAPATRNDVVVYGMFGSDAYNCFSTDGNYTSSCDLTAETKPDHYRSILNLNKRQWLKSLFVAFAGIGPRDADQCSNLRPAAEPATSDPNDLDNRFAQLSYEMQKRTYPETQIANANLFGNVCASAATYSTSFIANISAAVEDLAAKRITLNEHADDFDPPYAADYDLAVMKDDSPVAAAGNWEVRAPDASVGQTIVLKALSGTVAVNAFSFGSFGTLKFDGLLKFAGVDPARPVAGTVKLVYPGAPGGGVTCVEGTSFTNNAYCRYQNGVNSIWINKDADTSNGTPARGIPWLPIVPKGTAGEQTVYVRFQNEVEAVSSLARTAAAPIVRETIAVERRDGSDWKAQSYRSAALSNGGKTLTVDFGANLATGEYRIRFSTITDVVQTEPLGLELRDNDPNALICSTYDATIASEGDDGFKISRESARWPCDALADNTGDRVRFGTRLNTDSGEYELLPVINGKRMLRVGLYVYRAAKDSIQLAAPPVADTLHMRMGAYGGDENAYAAVPDTGYDFASESVIMLHPTYIIAPGKRLVGDYYVGSAEFTECYALEKWDEQGDEVTTTAVVVAPDGDEHALADTEYDVRVDDDGRAMFCPLVGQDFGYQFKVKRESEVHSSSTDTETKQKKGGKK